MDRNKPVIEPDFSGAPMRMPTVGNNRPEPPAKQSSLVNAPIIILLFLILAAILGGFYYWYTIVMKEQVAITTTRPTNEQNNEPESTTAEARTQIMDVVSTSDDLGAIKADAETTNLADLDAEVTPIEGELNAALQAKQ